MKYGTATETDKTLTGGNVGAPQQFSIQSSQIAFETLSSRLYSDPIRAVIRELSCNAYDAHVAVGKKGLPFEVQLPTNFDPSFRIKDFGPGMDDEQVRTLYCTYFASDKTKSNDAIGAFGLGSKSPFAYFLRNGKKSGGFTVVSRQDGMERIYTAVIKDGYPNVIPLSEFKTKKPDGLEVSFPVEQRDVWEFENKAKVVFEFFDPQPKTNRQLDVSRPEYSIKTDKWGLRKEASTPQGNKLRAIMGCVAYAIGDIDVSRLTEDQQRIFNMPLDFFFQIGDVNPAVSRENLQLDDSTIAAILKALDSVSAEVLEQVRKKIDAAGSAWEGRLVVWNLLQHHAIGKIVTKAYETGTLSGKYKNFSLEKGKDLSINELDYSSLQITRFEHNWRHRKNADRSSMLGMTPEEKNEARKAIAAGMAERERLEREFEISPRVAFVIDDMKGHTAKRFVSCLVQMDSSSDANDKRLAYLLSGGKDAEPGKVMEEVSRLLARLGNPPTMLASCLRDKYLPLFPKRTPVPREKGVLKFNENRNYLHHSSGWRTCWRHADATEVESGKTKYYITVERKNREGGNEFGIKSARVFNSFVEHLRQSHLFGLENGFPIFALRKNSKLRRDPEWVSLKAHIEENINLKMTPGKEAALSLRVNPFSTDWEPALEYIAKHNALGDSSPLQEFADALRDARKACGETGAHIASVLDIMKRKVTNTVDFNKDWKRVKKFYPMLGICRRDSYGTWTPAEFAAIIAYAKMEEQEDARKPREAKAMPAKPKMTPEAKKAAYRARKAAEQRKYYRNKKEREKAAEMGSNLIVTVEPGDKGSHYAPAALPNTFRPLEITV